MSWEVRVRLFLFTHRSSKHLWQSSLSFVLDWCCSCLSQLSIKLQHHVDDWHARACTTSFYGALLVPDSARIPSMNGIASRANKSITNDWPMMIKRPCSIKCSHKCRNSERSKVFRQTTRCTFIHRWTYWQTRNTTESLSESNKTFVLATYVQ